MHLRSAVVGWAGLFVVLGFQARAEACSYEAPSVGWSPTARLPRSLTEADLLARQALEPMPALPPGVTTQSGYYEYFAPWFARVTGAAARAGAWYLTDAIGEAPFNEQARARWQTAYEPLPELGPSTAAYVLLGEASWTELDQLEAALAEPREGVSSEQYIDALESVGSLFVDITTAAKVGSTPETSDYITIASETTYGISRALFYRCRIASTEMQVWTEASRRCEVWLGRHWKSQLELAPLDELLPIADQVPPQQYSWAPLARNRAD